MAALINLQYKNFVFVFDDNDDNRKQQLTALVNLHYQNFVFVFAFVFVFVFVFDDNDNNRKQGLAALVNLQYRNFKADANFGRTSSIYQSLPRSSTNFFL